MRTRHRHDAVAVTRIGHWTWTEVDPVRVACFNTLFALKLDALPAGRARSHEERTQMDYEVLDVDSQHPKVEQHLLRVTEGVYGLPEFQRTFVWDHDRIRGLWDSLYRGFP